MATSAVIGQLRVDLSMDSARFQQGAVRAQTQMRGLQQSTQQLQRSTNAFNGRGLLQQLSQVAQQTTATGRPMQALAVQAADIGMAFGPMGIAIGAVAGLVLPQLISTFGGGVTAAEAFAASLDATKEAVSALDKTVASISSLERDYKAAIEDGNIALAERIAKLIELRAAEAEYQALQLPRLIREQEEALRDLTDQQDEAARALSEAAAAAQDALNGGDAGQFAIALVDVEAAREAFEDIKTQVDLASNRAEQLSLQFDIAKESLDDTSVSAEEIKSSLANAAISTREIGNYADAALGPMNALLASARSVDGALYSAAVNAANLANQQALLAGAQDSAAQSVIIGGVRPSAEDIVGTQEQRAAINTARVEIERYRAEVEAAARATNGGGGGGGGAAGAVEELASVSETLSDILRDAGDPVQDFKDSIQGITDGAVNGFIDELTSGFEDGMKGLQDLLESTIQELSAYLLKNALKVQIEAAGQQISSALGGVGGTAAAIALAVFSLFRARQQRRQQERRDRRDERANLETQILQLQGNTAELRRRELEALRPGNRELQRRINRLEDEAARTAERESLETQLLTLQGDTAELRRRELATLDPANRELQKRIYALEDETAIAAERVSLERELLLLTGDTDALRAMELEQLDETNRALQEQIWAEQDRQEAIDETTRAIQEAVNAINPQNYASNYEYQRALALAANGLTVANTNAPITAASVPVVDNGSNDPAVIELQTIRQLSNSMLTRLANLENISRKWDVDGLPDTRATA